MRQNRWLFFLCLLGSLIADAQTKKLTLEGSMYAGLLEGQQGSAFQTGFTAGLRLKTWSAALGSGLDYYSVRSIPVYLQVQKNIFSKKQTPFVFVSGGHHFTWQPNEQNTDGWGWGGETKTRGGLYYSAGLGYQLPVLKNEALFFTAGYSFKQYNQASSYTICPFVGPCYETAERFSYRLRRLSITTGLRF